VSNASAAPDRTRFGDALGVPEFRSLFIAYTISLMGSVVAAVALTVLVYQRTGSPFLSSLTFAIGFVPYLLSGTLLSSLVDRVPIRRLLVTCDLACAGLACTMAIPAVPVAALLGLLLAVGILAGVSSGARSALLPTMVAQSAYIAGASLFRIAAQFSQIVGNGIGGALLVVLSPRGAILVDATSFLVSAALIRSGVRSRDARGTLDERPSILRDSLAGFRAVLARPGLRRLMLFGWLVPTCSVAPEALAAPYVSGIGGSASLVGWWLVALPIGVTLGDLLGVWLLTATRQRRLVGALAAWSFLPYLAFLAHPAFGPAFILLVVAGLGSAYSLGFSALVLQAAPDDIRGRALAINTSGLMFLQGLGFATAGAIAELVSPHVTIALAGMSGLVVVVLLRPRSAGGAPVPA